MRVQSLGQEDPLEEEMAIHSSILGWRNPGTEETGGLQSPGCKELDMSNHAYKLTMGKSTGPYGNLWTNMSTNLSTAVKTDFNLMSLTSFFIGVYLYKELIEQ